MSGFQTPISIKEAINKIVERKYLLPAIQRKFVWSATFKTSMLCLIVLCKATPLILSCFGR